MALALRNYGGSLHAQRQRWPLVLQWTLRCNVPRVDCAGRQYAAVTRQNQQPNTAYSSPALSSGRQQPTDTEAAAVENRGKNSLSGKVWSKALAVEWALRPLGALGPPPWLFHEKWPATLSHHSTSGVLSSFSPEAPRPTAANADQGASAKKRSL